MNMKKELPIILYVISFLIYVIACFMPAYVEARDQMGYIETVFTEYVDCPGWICLMSGIFLPIGMMMGFWGVIVWIANVYYFAGIIMALYSAQVKWLKILCSFLAIFTGLSFPFYTLHYSTRDYLCWVDSIQAGYYLWMLSFITLLIGLIVEELEGWVKRMVISLSLIIILIIGFVAIKHSNDKGDNYITFDENTQSIVAEAPISKLLVIDTSGRNLIHSKQHEKSRLSLDEIRYHFINLSKDRNPLQWTENKSYEIYNCTHKRVPKQGIRIKILDNGKAISLPIPSEDGDNNFFFDIEKQTFKTHSYFDDVGINDGQKNRWFLSHKEFKLTELTIKDINDYFEEIGSNFKMCGNNTYIIINSTFYEKPEHRIKIHLNENMDVDSVSYLTTK